MPISQNVNKKFSNVVARAKAWFICNFVSYHDSVNVFRFVKTNEWQLQPASAGFNPLFTIVHRNEYSEFHRVLPIADLKELKAVLRMEMSGQAKHLISDLKQNSRNVSSYEFSESTIKDIAFYRALIPASRVIAASAVEDVCVIEVNNGQPYFISKFNGAVSSQKKTSIINSVEMFCMSSGVADSSMKLTINDDVLPKHLAEGLLRLSLTDIFNFSFFTSRNPLLHVRSFLLVSGVVVLTYMCLTSIALQYQQKTIAKQIDELGPQLDLLLNKQQELVTLENAVDEVNATVTNNQHIDELIQLLIDVKANNAIINDYQSGPNGVSIRGQVVNASEFLIKLRALGYVGSAEFKAPTVKVENFEEYSVLVVLKRTKPHG